MAMWWFSRSLSPRVVGNRTSEQYLFVVSELLLILLIVLLAVRTAFLSFLRLVAWLFLGSAWAASGVLYIPPHKVRGSTDCLCVCDAMENTLYTRQVRERQEQFDKQLPTHVTE
jgi:hypothetical protein